MFAKSIIDSDFFLDMPVSTQCLYFHLSLRADDDGFVSNPKRIQKMIGFADDDLRMLIAKQFLIPFDSGIVVIKHWRIHNYIRNDRYKETIHQAEKSLLALDDGKAYNMVPIPPDTNGIPTVDQRETQVRLGKVSLVEDSLGEYEGAGAPAPLPAPEEPVQQGQGKKKKNTVDFEKIIDAYLSPDGESVRFEDHAERRDLLLEWIKVRKAKRAAMTDRAISMNLEKLDQMARESKMSVCAYLKEVIRRGWAAFFVIKDYEGNNAGPRQNRQPEGNIFLDMANERRGGL